MLPFLLGFSVPVIADESCGKLPNGWFKIDSKTVKSGSEYYALMQMETEPRPGGTYGVWNCDNNEARAQWNVSGVDCITAIDKYNAKTGANFPYPDPGNNDPKTCPP